MLVVVGGAADRLGLTGRRRQRPGTQSEATRRLHGTAGATERRHGHLAGPGQHHADQLKSAVSGPTDSVKGLTPRPRTGSASAGRAGGAADGLESAVKDIGNGQGAPRGERSGRRDAARAAPSPSRRTARR